MNMKKPAEKNNFDIAINPHEAAGAALAQTVANTAQDQTDLIRNQNIIKTTVMASAYAKWLANPMMQDEYSAIIKEAKVSDPKTPFDTATKVMSVYQHAYTSQRKD
ncbi:hypothetical protein [uncultured Shewanella sp.]|uniref:hypothetical protein n=1 Tax=uncultured Shewanella sp. TaxID=173975 RepID=UPI00263A0A8B|nr:hypothetical protein [uncultured Shewanella sp.]